MQQLPGRFRHAVLASIPTTAALFVLLVVAPEVRSTTWINDMIEMAVPGGLAGACLFAARRHEGRARRGLYLLAASMASWALGQAIWNYYELGLNKEVPTPGVADVFYLAQVPLAVAAILVLPTSRMALRPKLRTVLDGLIVAAAVLVCSWVIVLERIYQNRDTDVASMIVNLAYPIGDVAMIVMVLLVLSRAGKAWRPHLLMIGIGMVAIAVADSTYAYLDATDRYGVNNVIDIGWVVGFQLIGLAALLDTPDDVAVEDVGIARTEVYLPFAALLAAVVVTTVQMVREGKVGTFIFTVGSLTLLLVLARQMSTLSDNRQLTERLLQTQRELQEVVDGLRTREEDLTHRAFHDPLTKLPNRALFRDRLEHALALRRSESHPPAVLFLDLDDFKRVNDHGGHAVGDELLIAVAERLRACVRPSDTLARFGGDEFAVLLEETDGLDPTSIAQRVVDALQAPFNLASGQLTVRASIGIAVSHPGAQTWEELLQGADVAMYSAKSHGKGRWELYEPEMHAAAAERQKMLADLGVATRMGEVAVQYQPVCELSSGDVVAVEALLRWAHPVHGLLRPDAFLEMAERSGIIHDLGRALFDQSTRQLREWQKRWPANAPLSLVVNVSGEQLSRPSFVADVGAVIERAGIRPASLVIEVTEQSLAGEKEQAEKQVLEELRAIGVRISLANFGIGLSSLGHLSGFPIDMLKLPAQFVRDIDSGDGDAAGLARAILRLGQSLALDTVAESVERESQAEQLLQLGCGYAQGYLFSEPLSAAEMTYLLSTAEAGIDWRRGAPPRKATAPLH